MAVAKSKYYVYKDNEGDKVWWVDGDLGVGEFVFTFDKKNMFNLFADYPEKLSVEEWFAFNDENPYWRKFFKSRNREYATNHIREIEQVGRLKDISEYFG